MYKKLCLCFFLIAGYSATFAQSNPEAKRLQKVIASVVKKVMPATIKIAAFDTVSQMLAVSRFSGVIVSADGLILTAAHATQPKKVYQICFPDGRKVLAKGLGRIALGKDKPTADVAMLQIIEKGKWPFAEMGYSSEMRNGQPCVGISFPGTFEQQLPNIRLGRLENVNIEKENFQSSCKMEPGDSGGALFDAKGRLIGIHSWILPDEKQNFEVPVDLYRKYWNALHIPISYDHLPKATALANRQNTVLDSIPPLDLLAKLKPEAKAAVLNIRSEMGGRLQLALGTVVRFESTGKTIKGIITKNSTTGNQILVMIGGKQLIGQIIARDVSNDLALIGVKEELPYSILIDQSSRIDAPTPGTLLFSALPDARARTGIASTGIIEMLFKYSSGYFGASANFIEGKVTITSIPKGCPADGILQLNDQITIINGVTMDRPEKYGAELAKYYPNDTVAIDAVRNGQNIKLKVRLGVSRPNMHAADGFPGGRSIRSDGFKTVIAQDAALKTSECGGPVFNADGDFIGINIGRHSRTSTIIMPAQVIVTFCGRYKILDQPLKTDAK